MTTEKKKETSKEIVAALLVLTIIVSVVGSYILLTGIGPTVEQDAPSTLGKVKLFVMNIATPDTEGATVKLNVVNQGG